MVLVNFDVLKKALHMSVIVIEVMKKIPIKN